MNAQIMFRCYVTHAQAKSYLLEMIEAGLIEYDKLDRRYRSTVRGLEQLSSLEKMHEMLELQIRKAKTVT